MRVHTQEFREQLARGAEVVAEADLYRGNDFLRTLPVTDGNWSEDQSALIRTTAEFTLASADPEDIIPSANPLDVEGTWPTGNEIRLRVGVKFPSGRRELLDIGTFRISRPKAAQSVDGGILVTVSAADRSRVVQRSRFGLPYIIRKGEDYATAIANLLHSRLPYLDRSKFQFMRTDGSGGSRVWKTPAIVFLEDNDPWDELTKMATAIGAELFFNGEGNPVLRPIPDPSFSEAMITYTEGNGTTISASRNLDDEQTYNGVIASGINSSGDVIAWAQAWDTDPNSPTYYDPAYPEKSAYGAAPYFLKSEYITTNAQALAAARGNLPKQKGVLEAVEFEGVPNFAHQAGDILQIELPKIGATGLYILQSFRSGISHAGTLSGTTKKRQVAL